MLSTEYRILSTEYCQLTWLVLRQRSGTCPTESLHRVQKCRILLRRSDTHPYASWRAPSAQRAHADSFASQPLAHGSRVFTQVAAKKICPGRKNAIAQFR